ncbi:MAG: hypothetical protein RI897_1049, partial [Verrucomicrobiota bacterium]
AVHRNWSALDRQRMDRHERHASLYMTKRHRALVLKLQDKLPIEQWALDRYQRWLQRLMRSAARRNQ